MACLLAALLPLVVAAGMLINKRRFSLQSLFAVVALVAVFLGVSALPLYEFHHARRLAKQLVSANATLHTDSSLDDFYSQIRYVPRPAPSIRTVGYDLPPWLKPFAGNSSAIPPDETVQEIWLDSDDQDLDALQCASLLRNLTCISVAPGVTAAGMEELRTTLPKFPRLTHIHVSSVKIPKNWLPSLVNIRSLWIWGEGSFAGSRLTDNQLSDLASLPNLQVLMVYGLAISDSDVKILARCKGLRHIYLRHTAVTQSGEETLEAALPQCVVHRN